MGLNSPGLQSLCKPVHKISAVISVILLRKPKFQIQMPTFSPWRNTPKSLAEQRHVRVVYNWLWFMCLKEFLSAALWCSCQLLFSGSELRRFESLKELSAVRICLSRIEKDSLCFLVIV